MSIATQGIRFGAHTPVLPGGDRLEAINLLESRINRRLDLVLSFRRWGALSGQPSKDTETSLQQSSGAGRAPLVTWEPMLLDNTAGPYTLASIAAGLHDAYIDAWVAMLAKLGTPVYLRFAHEMNGNWYPWSGDPESYKAAWRHLVERFAPAPNVAFVWCVNTSDQPKGNALEAYFPGAQWVDVLGVDGYNNYWQWRSFGEVIGPAVARLAKLDPDLPIWVCETATNEGDPARWVGTGPGSKAAWIADLFATEGMDRLGAVCYFNETGGYEWPLTSSPAALQAMRDQLRAATGWVAPPGPYVPPVPDRVTAVSEEPGSVRVAWRTVPSFCRGYRVYVDGRLQATVEKPALHAYLRGLPAGRHSITVASYTLLRTSRPSVPVEVDIW